jgi:hypothetical protein
MEFEPENLTEKAGAALGVVGHRIQGDLGRFKEFIEHQGTETGGWRGEVDRAPQQGESRMASRGGSPAQSVPPQGDTGFGTGGSVPGNPADLDRNRPNPL